MMDLLQRIAAYIRKHRLMDTGKRYLVALSGGADSVCLLRALLMLGYRVEAVHCNFNLRGVESKRDEEFVRNICQILNVELHVIHFDTKTYAELHKVSIEMAARALRYGYFEQLRQDIGADDICVAHHADDSIETMLINLIRGTGLHGLTGIKPRNAHIIRPLLAVRRNDITAWLKSIGQDYVTDSTNLKPNVMRNKVRLQVLPLLRTLSPGIDGSILATAAHLTETERVYDAAVKASEERVVCKNSVDIYTLLNEPSPESILHYWLKKYSFSSASIEEIAHSLNNPRTGSVWTSATHQLTIHRGRIILEPLQEDLPTLRMPETGNYVYRTRDIMIRLRLCEGGKVSKAPWTASLDASKIQFPLTLRPVQPGDRFLPYGMKGTRLVSDYLTDRHLSIFEKRRTLVLCDDQGRILWLVGHRTASPFCVTPSTSKTLVAVWEESNRISQ